MQRCTLSWRSYSCRGGRATATAGPSGGCRGWTSGTHKAFPRTAIAGRRGGGEVCRADVRPSAQARATFQSFVHSHNAAFVRFSDATAATTAGAVASSRPHSPAQPTPLHSTPHPRFGDYESGRDRRGSFDKGVENAATAVKLVKGEAQPQQQQQLQPDAREAEVEGHAAHLREVSTLREWSLKPLSITTTAASKRTGEASSSVRDVIPKRSRSEGACGGPCHYQAMGAEQQETIAHGEENCRSGVRPAHRPLSKAPQHYRTLLREATEQTAAQLARRHERMHEEACLHAYRIVKQVEWSMLQWAAARRRQGRREWDSSDVLGQDDGGGRCISTSSTAGAAKNVDAVDAHFFEYAGQVQRTLHQLTPRHFDAIRTTRLRLSPHHLPRSTSRRGHAEARADRQEEVKHRGMQAPRAPAPSAPQPPLLLLRFLWRLLHIQQLFYSIGRHASLPRSAISVYVQSSSCQYGVREVLRILGREIALCLGRSSSAVGTGEQPFSQMLLSNDELFQVFYAVLCIPSEDAPGVPRFTALHPTTAPPQGPGDTDAGASAHSTSFARATSDGGRANLHREGLSIYPDATCTPLDEWCVRWWAHRYALCNAAAAAGAEPPSLPLTMGQAMDVVRACLYATKTARVVGAALTTRRSAFQQPTLLAPFFYFETHPTGTSRQHRAPFRSATVGSAGKPFDAPQRDPTLSSSPLRFPEYRYRPYLKGALGGDPTSQRIPHRLGQHFVQVFLEHLLSHSARNGKEDHGTASTGCPADRGGGGNLEADRVAASMRQMLLRRDRDAVRDIALLCTAILFFEVFSPATAAFMAHAAPLCREQAELMNGHQISCVLLAYASLQRWERRGRGAGDLPHTDLSNTPAGRYGGNSYRTQQKPTIKVQSASVASSCSNRISSSSFSSSTVTEEDWQLFYVTLGSRAGQLGDMLSEDDITRVLRAMELTGMEHADLRRALESSLRMRNLGRRVLYET